MSIDRDQKARESGVKVDAVVGTQPPDGFFVLFFKARETWGWFGLRRYFDVWHIFVLFNPDEELWEPAR